MPAARSPIRRWTNASERDGFIAVYPEGTGGFLGKLHTGNAGKCCGYAMGKKVDDVGFTIALLDDLAARTSIERRRIYATGLSNGAMTAYRLAAERSDRIAAVAAVAGGVVVDSFALGRPVPVMHIHSIDDPRALHYGGLGPPFPFTSNRVNHQAVEDTLGQWTSFDRCATQAAVSPTIRGRSASPDEGNTATKYVYQPCAGGTEVVLWKLTGSGYVWPGGVRDQYKRLLGKVDGRDRRQRGDVGVLRTLLSAVARGGAP
jgi:polyhydroxybutyrate depolymerase